MGGNEVETASIDKSFKSFADKGSKGNGYWMGHGIERIFLR